MTRPLQRFRPRAIGSIVLLKGIWALAQKCLQTKKTTDFHQSLVEISNCLAEREGFEPPEPRSSTVFKTAAIDHSAISPGAKVKRFLHFTKFYLTFSSYQLYKLLIFNAKHFEIKKMSLSLPSTTN